MTTADDIPTLLEQLHHADPDTRSAAAVALGQRHRSRAAGLPETPALMAQLADHDAAHPGVADAFWTTVVYDFLAFETTFPWTAVKAWMLQILAARRGRPRDTPVPGNDLEFHAHETFDDDADALTTLLAAGYDDVVRLALDHGALDPAAARQLLKTLHARTHDPQLAETLAIHHGVLVPDAPWPLLVLPGDQPAHHIQRDYAARRLWTVHWLFPTTPATLPTAPADLLAALLTTTLPIATDEAALAAPQIDHIPFTTPPGTRRHTHHPRRDLQLDLAVDEQGRVHALRIVRALRMA